MAIAAMSVGVILSNRQLKGSCGGLMKVVGEDCLFCEKKEDCKEEIQKSGYSDSNSANQGFYC